MISYECPACNTPNEDTQICCTMCGKRLPWAPAPTPTVLSPPTVPPPTPKTVLTQPITLPQQLLPYRQWIALAAVALILFGAFKTGVVRLPVRAVYDVPSLIGKPIDEVGATLGRMSSKKSSVDLSEDMTRTIGPTTTTMTWKRGEVELTALYDRDTGVVSELFVTTDDPSGETRDEWRTLRLANLNKEGDRQTSPSGGRYDVKLDRIWGAGPHTGVTAYVK